MKPGMRKIINRHTDRFRRVIRTFDCDHTAVEPKGGGCDKSIYGLCKKCNTPPSKTPADMARIATMSKLESQMMGLEPETVPLTKTNGLSFGQMLGINSNEKTNLMKACDTIRLLTEWEKEVISNYLLVRGFIK